MWTTPTQIWVEKDFGGPIFWIFYFQNSPPIWDISRVKFFFQNFKVEYVISVIWPSPYIITTETQLYILDFYEWYNVKSGLIIKSISNSWIILKFQIPTYPTPCTPTIPLPYTPSNHRNWNTCNEHGMVTVLTHHPLCVHLES